MPALNPFFAFYVTDADSDICLGMTVSGNNGNVFYKCLESLRYDKELRGYVERHDQQVDHGTAAVVIVENIVQADILNERNVHKSRRQTEVLEPYSQVAKHEGTARSILEEFADEWTLTQSNSGSSTTNQGATTSTGYLLLASDTTFHNPANWHLDSFYVAAWGTRTREYWDEELGLKVTETRSVVPHGTAMSAPTAILWPEQKQADAWRDILTTLVPSGAFSRTYKETIQFSFPTLLASWDGDETHAPVVPDWAPGNGWVALAFEQANLRSVFQLSPRLRESWTEGVRATVTENLVTAAERAVIDGNSPVGAFGAGTDLGTSTTPARIWNPRPRDISYNGLMFEFHAPNVLCDGATITATKHADDEYYDSAMTAEAFTYPSSNITATAYIALIGSQVAVEDSFRPWKFGLFMRRRVYVTLK